MLLKLPDWSAHPYSSNPHTLPPNPKSSPITHKPESNSKMQRLRITSQTFKLLLNWPYVAPSKSTHSLTLVCNALGLGSSQLGCLAWFISSLLPALPGNLLNTLFFSPYRGAFFCTCFSCHLWHLPSLCPPISPKSHPPGLQGAIPDPSCSLSQVATPHFGFPPYHIALWCPHYLTFPWRGGAL